MPLILVLSLLTLLISPSAQLAEAQQPKKVPRIGVLSLAHLGPHPCSTHSGRTSRARLR